MLQSNDSNHPNEFDLAKELIIAADGLFIPVDPTGPQPPKLTPVSVTSFLGAMLECAPDDGRHYVIDSINRTEGDPEELQKLAVHWFHFFIMPMRVLSLRTSTFLDAPESQGYDVSDEVDPATRTATLDDKIKKREGYRTSIFHVPLEDYPEIEPEELRCRANVARIIPWYPNSQEKTVTDPGVMREIAGQFGGIPPNDLMDSQINQPSNYLILRLDEHSGFEEFLWCLHPDTHSDPPIPNCYIAKRLQNFFGFPPNGTVVTFVNHCDQNDTTDLPDPRLLRLHAAIAEVLHMSGAGGYIGKYLEDLMHTHVLAADGGSSIMDLLTVHSLAKLMV